MAVAVRVVVTVSAEGERHEQAVSRAAGEKSLSSRNQIRRLALDDGDDDHGLPVGVCPGWAGVSSRFFMGPLRGYVVEVLSVSAAVII